MRNSPTSAPAPSRGVLRSRTPLLRSHRRTHCDKGLPFVKRRPARVGAPETPARVFLHRPMLAL